MATTTVQTVNIEIHQGKTFECVVNVQPSADLSAFSGRGEIRATFGSASPVLASFTVTIDDTNKQVTFALSSAVTTQLAAGTDPDGVDYRYDIELYDSDDVVVGVCRGVATVFPEVTL